MARDYGAYGGNDSDNNSSSDDDNGGDDSARDMNLTITPYAEFEGELVKVFGNSNRFGQSLGVAFEDLELIDGCLYHDPDKDNYKLFSWKAVLGMMPGEGDFESGDANQFLVKTYGSTEKRYELVEAVHPDKDDPVPIGNACLWYSGSSAHGPKSASKTLAKILTQDGRNAMIEEDDWYDSLSKADQRRADLDPDDDKYLSWVSGWLADTSGDNLCRDDLEGRRFNFFEVKKDSNNSDRKYHHPIVEDSVTGTTVTVDNNVSSGEQGTLDGDGEAEPAPATDGGTAAAEPAQDTGPSRREDLENMEYSALQTLGSETDGATGSGSTEEIIQSIIDAENGVPAAQTEEGVPEPITDFVSSVEQFSDFTRERAETLLEDFVTDDGLPLTQDLVDDFGGQDAVLSEAGY